MILKVFLLFLLNHVVLTLFSRKKHNKKRFPKELDLNNKKAQ